MTITQEQYQKRPDEDINAYTARIQNLRSAEEEAARPAAVLAALNSPSVITSDNLTPTTPITPVEPTPADIPSFPTNAGTIDTSATEPGKTEKSVSDTINEIMGMNEGLAGKEAYTTEQENVYGLAQLTATETELTDRYNQLLRDYQESSDVINAQSKGRGRSAGAINIMTMDRQRQLTSESNMVSGLLAATKSKMSIANMYIERAVKAKYGQLEADIATKKANLELLLKDPNLSIEEKNRANAQLEKQKAEEKKIADEKEEQTSIWNIAVTAAGNGANFKPNGTYKTLAEAQMAIQKAKTKEEALQIATDAGLVQAADTAVKDLMTKYPDAKILPTDTIEQAQNKLTNSKIYQKAIEKSGGSTYSATVEAVMSGEYGSLINTAANLYGTKFGQESARNTIASLLASGDYATAYKTMAEAVEQSLTGTNKTQFSSARTDYEVMDGMRKAIEAYSAGGGNMGLLTGTEEDIKRKLGIDSGKASELAVQLWREFQYYRSNMTGAAFTEKESRDYASVNPTLGKSLNLNLSVIQGAMNQLENRITSTVNSKLPNAKGIYSQILDFDADAEYNDYLNATGQGSGQSGGQTNQPFNFNVGTSGVSTTPML